MPTPWMEDLPTAWRLSTQDNTIQKRRAYALGRIRSPVVQDRKLVRSWDHYDKLPLYEGESNENSKFFFKFNLLNESGTQLYHFST
jgi:hypothetical protein